MGTHTGSPLTPPSLRELPARTGAPAPPAHRVLAASPA